MASTLGAMKIQLPIIVVDKNGVDLSIFQTIDIAEKHLEAIDVNNNEYEVFDSAGHQIILRVVKQYRKILGFIPILIDTVKMEIDKDSPSKEEYLKQALITILVQRNQNKECDLPNLNIEQLINKIGIDK